MTDVLFLIRGVSNYHLVVYPHSIGVPGATDYILVVFSVYPNNGISSRAILGPAEPLPLAS
jgi:hypothetical protein